MVIVQTAVLIVQTTVLIVQTAVLSEVYYPSFVLLQGNTLFFYWNSMTFYDFVFST